MSSTSTLFPTTLVGSYPQPEWLIQIMLGCLDLDDPIVETPESIVARIKRALPYVQPENVILAPDCGMKRRGRQDDGDGGGGQDAARRARLTRP